MEIVRIAVSGLVGVGVGVIFSGKIAGAVKSLEATVEARLVAIEAAIVAKVKKSAKKL